MKSLRRILSIFLLLIIVASSQIPLQAQSSRMKDRFYLGGVNFFFEYGKRTPTNLPWYTELSYNMMFSFCAHLDKQPPEWGTWQYDGGFFEPLPSYKDYVKSVIGDWNTIAHDNSLVYEREKVLRPCFGQRSTYRVNNPGTWEFRFPGYGYKQTTGITGQDYRDYEFAAGDSVRMCSIETHSPGYVMKHLYENCEQVNIIDSVDDDANSTNLRLYSDVKDHNSDARWFIKPRIRIDSVYAKSHPDDTVCVLYVNRFDGQLLKSFPILCKNFLQYYNFIPYYNGDYLEMLYHINNRPDNDNTPDAFNVSAWDLKEGRGNYPYDSSHVDYYVRWPGYVDMYLQYLRVDDSWSHYLFTDSIGDKSKWKFSQKIDSETVAFANNSGFSYYWLDEISYNSIPCAEEVNRLIKKYSGNQTSFLTFGNIDNMRWRTGLRNSPMVNVNFIPDLYLAQMDSLFVNNYITNVFVTELYPFQFGYSYPPNVLKPSSILYPKTQYYTQATTVEQYTQDVQNALFWNIFYHKTNINLAKKYGMPYNVTYQVHSDEYSIHPPPGKQEWGLREPTNEEIRMQSYLSLAYGAKQLYEYVYYSQQQSYGTEPAYAFGLVGLPSGSHGEVTTKRTSNYYGQNKWDFVVNLNQKLKLLGDFMYPPGTANHFVYDNAVSVPKVDYCSVCEGLPYSYLTNLNTYYNDNGISWDNPEVLSQDPANKRYFEVGFFSHPSSTIDKYMLLVNKRCTPVQGGYGDLRTIKLVFNPSSLAGFNNWVLCDVMTGDKVVFDKNNISNGVYFPYVFQPGEGKLLKLAPVMQMEKH